MKVTIIPIGISAFSPVSKGLFELSGALGNKTTSGDYYGNKNSQNTEKGPVYLRRPEESSCHSNSSERPPAKADAKNSQGVNNNNP